MHSNDWVVLGEGTAMLLLIAVPFLLTVTSMQASKAHRRKEMEHAERMKALEMGLVPQPSGLDWPAAAVCIAVGAGVPIGSFLVSWLATLTADAPDEIWFAPVLVSFAAIGTTRKLAYRIIDPKSGSRKDLVQRAAPDGKGAFDPDAFDVVGSRG